MKSHKNITEENDMKVAEIKKRIKKSGKTFLPLHKCGLCKYQLGFIIADNLVQYDRGCYCTKYPFVRTACWDEIAAVYNIRPAKEKAELGKEWGIEE